MAERVKVLFSSDPNIEILKIEENGLKVIAAQDNTKTTFMGVASNNTFLNAFPNNAIVDLLIKGFNNRTRERNYYRLYSSLLEGKISEEEFDNEIDDNPGEYVIPMDSTPSPMVTLEALKLSKYLMDIQSSSDFEAAFSFKEGQTEVFFNSFKK
ncbi:MAG: hypothetical protein K2H15_06530 [Muribaculaceae bacterium]|nr:hypothetical protein [Muribaculaceae bacterium]